MPGKHAPESPASYYASLARAGAFALGVLGLVVVIVLVAMGSGDEPGLATGTNSPGPTPTRTTPGPTPTGTATASTSPTPTETPIVSRAKLAVQILNGTLRAGLAAGAQDKMVDEGYQNIEIGNAPPARRTTIFYKPRFKREAERLLADVPELLRVRPRASGTPGDAAIVVVLGEDYEG